MVRLKLEATPLAIASTNPLLSLQLYRPIGIRVFFTMVFTFTGGNLIPVSSNASTLLNSFTEDYVQAVLLDSVPYDSVMLLT